MCMSVVSTCLLVYLVCVPCMYLLLLEELGLNLQVVVTCHMCAEGVKPKSFGKVASALNL